MFKQILMIIAALFLFVIAFFTFAILGAGSHGHFGLFDHADSFQLYSIIYLCCFYGFRILFNSIKKPQILQFLKFGFLLFLLVLVLIFFAFVIELFSSTPNIHARDWIFMFVFSIILIIEIKQKIANKLL